MKNLYNRKYSIVEGLQYYIYLTINLHIRKLGSNFIKSDLDTIISNNSKVRNNYVFNLYQNFINVDNNTTISQLGESIGQGVYYDNSIIYVKLSSTIPVGQTCTLYDKFEQQSYSIVTYTPSSTNCQIEISSNIANLTFSPNRFVVQYGSTKVKVLYQLNQTSLDLNYFTDSEKELIYNMLDEFNEYSTDSFTNTSGLSTNYNGYLFYAPILNIDTTDTTNYNIIVNIYNIIEYYNFIKMFYFGLKSKIELALLDISRYSIDDVIDFDNDDINKIPHFNFNTKLFNENYTDWKNFLIFKFKQITFLYEFYNRESELFNEYFNLAIYDGMRDVTNVEYLNNIEVTSDIYDASFIYNRILKNSNQANFNLLDTHHILSYNTYQLYDRVIIPFQNNNLTVLDSGYNICYKGGLFKDHMKWMINSTSSPNYTSTQLLDLNITNVLSLYFSFSTTNILDLRNTNIYQELIQTKYYNKYKMIITTEGMPIKYVLKISENHNTYSTGLTSVSTLPNFNINYNMMEEVLNLVKGMNNKTVAQYTTYCTTNLHYLLNELFNQYDNDLVNKILQNILPSNYSGDVYYYQFTDIMKLYEMIQSYVVKYNHKKYMNFNSNFDNFKLDNVNNYNFIELFTGYYKNNNTYLGLNSIIDYINNSDSVYHMLSTVMIFLLNSSRLSYSEQISNTELNILKDECLNIFQRTNNKSIISVREDVMGIVKQIVVEQ